MGSERRLQQPWVLNGGCAAAFIPRASMCVCRRFLDSTLLRARALRTHNARRSSRSRRLRLRMASSASSCRCRV
eukprot:366569-Chlamydomonas_euryale.AAC.38